jgi:hypothetical protein
MNTPVSLIPSRRRIHGRKPPKVSPGPLAVVSVLDVATGTENLRVELAFNTTQGLPLLEPGELNYQKWSAVYNGYRYLASTVTLLGYNSIRVHMEQDDAQTGANAITFTGSTSDDTRIVDALGRELAAFSNLAI